MGLRSLDSSALSLLNPSHFLRLLLFVVNDQTNYNKCCKFRMLPFWGVSVVPGAPPGGPEGSDPRAGSGTGQPAQVRGPETAAVAVGEPRRAPRGAVISPLARH